MANSSPPSRATVKLSSHARNRVGLAQRIHQAARYSNQHFVSQHVAEAVIDHFETIEIKEQNGEQRVGIAFAMFE